MRLWENEQPSEPKPVASRDYETLGYVITGKAELLIEGRPPPLFLLFSLSSTHPSLLPSYPSLTPLSLISFHLFFFFFFFFFSSFFFFVLMSCGQVKRCCLRLGTRGWCQRGPRTPTTSSLPSPPSRAPHRVPPPRAATTPNNNTSNHSNIHPFHPSTHLSIHPSNHPSSASQPSIPSQPATHPRMTLYFISIMCI